MLAPTPAIGAAASTPAAAPAAPAPVVTAEQDRIARGLFEAGTLAFREGRYENALQHFQEAYRLSQRPLLFFNIGSTLDRLRRDQEALDAFERYLRELPQAPNHPAVEARIVLLREAIAAQQAQRAEAEAKARAAEASHAANEEPPAPVAPAAPPSERASDGLPPLAFWIGVGVTGVSVGLAIWSGLDTVSANDDYLEAPTKAAYEDALGRQSRTNALIGISAGLAVTTVVLALLTDWGGETETASARLLPMVSAQSVGCVVAGAL